MTNLIRGLGSDKVCRDRSEQLRENLHVSLRGALPQEDCPIGKRVSNCLVFFKAAFVLDWVRGGLHEARHMPSFAITVLRFHETEVL